MQRYLQAEQESRGLKVRRVEERDGRKEMKAERREAWKGDLDPCWRLQVTEQGSFHA